MKIFKPVSEKDFNEITDRFTEGALGILPTETVYGLAAVADNLGAVKRLYWVKNRPVDHPSIVHIGSKELLNFWAVDIPNFARDLIEVFWPGPLTLIFQKSPKVNSFITSGQTSIAIRYSNNPTLVKIQDNLTSKGFHGLVVPSANIFGKVSPTLIQNLDQELLKRLNVNLDFIVDDGPAIVGIESTIVDCRTNVPVMLRRGVITKSHISDVTGLAIKDLKSNSNLSINFSGSHPRHYVPNKPVVLNQRIKSKDGVIALSNIEIPSEVVRIASPATYMEFAAKLYALFVKADHLPVDRINVIIESDTDEIALAILDRVIRASDNVGE